MSSVRIENWNPGAVEREAVRSLHPRLQRLADELVTAMAEAISKVCPPHSEPGEPPHTETGELLASFEITSVQPGEIYVANTAAHAILLEQGTRKMAARPFIRPVLMRFRRRFSRVELGG